MTETKKVLVDTTIWSLAFRKKLKSEIEENLIEVLDTLIQTQQAQMIGAIRQEILSGITHREQ